VRARIQLAEEWLALEGRLAYDNEQLEAICQAHPACQRLRTVPGIGPLTAAALVAVGDDATYFENGRGLPHGWGSYHASILRVASCVCSGSAHAGIAICVNSSCTELGPHSVGSSASTTAGVSGARIYERICTGSCPESRSMALAIRLPSIEGEPERDAGVLTVLS
jgi:Transposase IS116/IS110/IS902 family